MVIDLDDDEVSSGLLQDDPDRALSGSGIEQVPHWYEQ